MTGAVSRQTYWPYGATRSTSGALTTDKLYTGQQQEPTGALQDATAALGLYYYHARFYSTTTGRFVSADTMTSDGLNRYMYVGDNPLRGNDPTGHCFVFVTGKELDCDAQKAIRWYECAYGGGCEGDVRLLARMGIRQDKYWDNVGKLFYANPWIPSHMIITVVERSSLGANRALNDTPAAGWNKLGDWFGVSGGFLKASLLDLMTGTVEPYDSNVGRLGSIDIIGAWAWWQPFGTYYGRFANAIDDFDRRAVRLAQALRQVTLQTAHLLDVDQVADQEWSQDQRELLAAFGFPIDPYGGGRKQQHEVDPHCRSDIKKCFIVPGLNQ